MVDNRGGVYAITNTNNGHQYIGSSTNIHQRWFTHLSALRKGKSPCIALQNAWNKYGESSFSHSVLEYVEDKTQLIPTEQKYMDTLHPHYNVRLIAQSRLGMKNRPESVEKMRKSLTGKTRTPEQRKRYGDSKRGTTKSPESREKNRIASTNPPAITRQRMSDAKKGIAPRKAIEASVAARRGVPRPPAVVDKIKATLRERRKKNFAENKEFRKRGPDGRFLPREGTADEKAV